MATETQRVRLTSQLEVHHADLTQPLARIKAHEDPAQEPADLPEAA